MIYKLPDICCTNRGGKKAQYGFLYKKAKGLNGKCITRKMTAEESIKYKVRGEDDEAKRGKILST